MQEKLPGVLKQMRLTPHTEDKHSSTSAVDTHTHTRFMQKQTVLCFCTNISDTRDFHRGSGIRPMHSEFPSLGVFTHHTISQIIS